MNKPTTKKFTSLALAFVLVLGSIVILLAVPEHKSTTPAPLSLHLGLSEQYTSIVHDTDVWKIAPLSAIELDIVEILQYEWINLGYHTLLAYCPCVQCCGIWSAEHPSRIGTDFVQRTASGTIPTAGRTIAVNPAVIPYGTYVKINGHIYIAEDTGAAVRRARIIDIFHDCHQEALEFGRQRAEVWIKIKN